MIGNNSLPNPVDTNSYLDYSERDDVLSGGVKMIPVNPTQMEMMSRRVPKGEYLYCPAGSHLSMYDDQEVYFDGLIRFVRNVEANCYDRVA